MGLTVPDPPAVEPHESSAPDLPRTRARAQYELSLERDFETLDRVYDVVELCGFGVDHLEVRRAGPRLHCHLVLDGWACGLQWLDDSVRTVRGVEVSADIHVCSICRGQGVR